MAAIPRIRQTEESFGGVEALAGVQGHSGSGPPAPGDSNGTE